MEENFTIEVQNVEAKKFLRLKFPQQNEVDTQDGETQEAETQVFKENRDSKFISTFNIFFDKFENLGVDRRRGS